MRIHTHLPTLLGSSLLLVLLGGCNSDDTGASDTLILDPSPDACASPHTILFGEMYECSGVRKARIDVEICTGLVCLDGNENWQPVQDFVVDGQPLVPEEFLDVEQSFASDDNNPPPTGACCSPTHPSFVEGDDSIDPPDEQAGSVRATAYIDCAARTCREVHDQLLELAVSIEAAKAALPQLEPFDPGYVINEAKKGAYQRAIDAMEHYAEHLEQPLWFQLCTSRLANPEGDLQTEPHSYVFPDPPDPGAGSLRRLVISNFKCLDLQCDVAPEDPTEGGGGSCFDNPNWSKQNVAPSVHGTGVPAPGSVVLTLDGTDTELQYTGVALAYARVPDCPQGATCPFVITDLRLDLPPITYGPVTLTAPRVALDRPAAGTQSGDAVALAAGELALRVESPIELLGAPILDGAVVPLFVRNHGTVALQLTAEGLALVQARFNLFAGATAELRIGSTSCDES